MTNTVSKTLYYAALSHEDVKEWPGVKHNPEVLKMFKASGHSIPDDETPWCAAFVGSVLAECGLVGTGSLAARSYQKWGDKVAFADARRGDIVVLWRGKRNGWQGHVAFFDGRKPNGDIVLLGGNQGNRVSLKAYSSDKILSIRRVKAPKPKIKSKTLAASTLTAVAGGSGTAISAIAVVDPITQYLLIGVFGIVVLAGLVIFRERLEKGF